MGIRSTRPLPLAHAELALAPFFRRRFRSWHLTHVRLALQRYRLLTTRGCVDALQLSAILGIKEQKLVDDVMRLFLPRTPTRVQCMVDVMEVLIALTLVCQAPGMLQRFELIFDVVDLEKKEAISATDLIMMCGVVGRAVMKLFEYKVEPEQHAATAYVTDVLDLLGFGRDGSIAKEALCKFMVSDQFAVHYVKQCTGEDKPKLYIMMEKDSEFLGAIEFSNEQHMQTTSLRNARDMIYAQIHRVPEDFTFLCQGREVEKIWEVDRRAWSIVPFALRGSPGLRTDILAKNRKIERPAVVNPFEFRYMGNLIRRYKKYVYDVKPVYKHRAFRLRKNEPRKRLEPVVQWRVATTWSGEWLYEQQLIKKHSKSHIMKSLRTAPRPPPGVLMVKSHFGEILSPWSKPDVGIDDVTLDPLPSPRSPIDNVPLTPSKSERRMQKIDAMNLRERKREQKNIKQKAQWKARLIAMESQHQMEDKNHLQEWKSDQHTSFNKKKVGLDNINIPNRSTVLVHLEEDNTLPSRLIRCEPKKRRRPKKVEYALYQWDVPGRFLSAIPPKCKKLKVTKISDEISLISPAGTSANKQVELGRFLSSTHIFLEDNEVEVLPVLIIRPIEGQICVNERDDEMIEDTLKTSAASASGVGAVRVDEEPLFASKTYLTEFEYEISTTESNFEALYQHIASGTLQDAILLNRRDVFGRTMLHDAAEFGHSNVMELLLKARVVVDTQDSKGDTALHHAARHGRLKEVSMLLREHATPWLLNFEGKSPLYCALETAAKRPARCTPLPEAIDSERVMNSKPVDDRKNFFLAHRAYPQLRQVVDLLWDNYKLDHLMSSVDNVHSSCLELEKQLYGDMIEACHDGNLLRIQRLVDLEKRPVLRYINDQMEFLRRTALHEATEQGHTATVDLLLKLGADGYLRDQRFQAPLHLAACKGYDNIVKCLISKFPQTMAYQDINGSTPLHLAVQYKHWSIAKKLISLATSSGLTSTRLNLEGQQVNCLDLQDVHGYTALHYACIHGNFDVCTALINANAAVSISQCEFRILKGTPHLLGLWWKGDMKGIGNRKRLLNSFEQYKIFDIEAPPELLLKGCQQHFLNYQERVSVLELLLGRERAADAINCDQPKVKIPPSPLFHLAAELADINISVAVEICRCLHKLQVEINMPHPLTGDTVLLQECKRICILSKSAHNAQLDIQNELALIRSLVELGANIDLANEVNGESPLGCAAWYGHLALLDLLLEAGADGNGFLRRCSFSPLHFAALGNNVACAKLLISHSARVDVEMPPTNAETPLYFAIRSKSEEVVELFLGNNADPCSLCTVQQNSMTSFGAALSLPAYHERFSEGSGNSEHVESYGISPAVVSPLTFGLMVAQPLKAFALPEEISCTVRRSQKRTKWEEMERICFMLAKRLLEDNGGSKGVVTRDDVELAGVVGFWGLVQLLLSQQITLSNAPSTLGMNALHVASSAGQTKIVTALVAGGMNVNCITRNNSMMPKQTVYKRRTRYEWIGCGHRGALFYALINGHTETAAKLLVLGANAELTIPHTCKKVLWRKINAESQDNKFFEHIVVRFVVSEAMNKSSKTGHLEKKNISNRQAEEGYSRKYLVDEASVNLIHLIECSINQKVPLLHLVVALGHQALLRILVNAGMGIFSGFVSPSNDQGSIAGWNAPAETPLHVAIACGHLETVKYFAGIVQNRFPGCFVKDGKTFKSLLVAACAAHQVSILRFLLCNDSDRGDGGGFTYEACKEEFQSALSTCAAVQFVEGFELLIQNGANPDVHTLVSALRGVTQSSKCAMARLNLHEIELLEQDDMNYRVSFSGERSDHSSGANSIDVGIKLLKRIIPPESSRGISDFIGTSPIFDVMLRILSISSRYQLWFVLNNIFVQHQDMFMDAASIWKPVVVRAAISSLVLHRAAMHNQTPLVAFLLRAGVPADLQRVQTTVIRCPIWYAASRGSLEAFICLALRSPSFVDDCLMLSSRSSKSIAPFHRELNAVTMVFRSIQESRSILSTSNTTCKWQNLSVFGCVDLPKRQTNGYLIQKFINYGIQISCGHVDNSLLHHASRRGELLAVQVLVEGGADLTAINRMGETPLEVASRRKDTLGHSVVHYLLYALEQNKIPAAANIIDRALICCFAEEAPCNFKIAQALLDSGAKPQFSCDVRNDERKASESGSTRVSAISYAMKSGQLAGVNLLLHYGAVITAPLSESFLARFLMNGQHSRQRHWRRFAAFVKHNGGKELLLNVEGIIQILLKKTIFPKAMNSDLVHQILTSASAIAATIAKEVGLAKQFWSIVNMIVDEYPKEVVSRKAEWNQKSALHYAVASLELPIVIKLIELRGLDLLSEDEHKQTPLHIAAAGGDNVICRLLLAKLQSNALKITAIDAPDARGRTALHLAVIHGHEAVASILLAAGASLDTRCRDGLTALLYAAKYNRLAILIALYSGAHQKPHDGLFAANGEAGIFVAARHGAFPVVRWFMSLYSEEGIADKFQSSSATKRVAFGMHCCFGRSILHYSAVHGDEETLELLVKATGYEDHSSLSDAGSSVQTYINERDHLGYTPLVYAFAFGKIRVARTLCELGADPYTSIDHSGDPGSHPYTVVFDIAGLLRWFALPGWYSFSCNNLVAEEKARQVRASDVDEDYFWNSSYNYRKKLRPPVEWRCKWKKIPAGRLLKSEPPRRGKELVRTSIRTWRFPRKSIFDYACEIGNAQLAECLVKLSLPQVFRSLTYQAQRCNFMQAVRWNRLDIVKTLVASAVPGSARIELTTGNHFLDFLEVGVECAVSRGLEDMAIYLVDQWQGIQENGQESATPSAFAFQFAPAFQVACIRRLPRLMECMIKRGGEHIIDYHWKEGSSLAYAFAFGHADIVDILLRNGADPSIPTSTYSVASVCKWVELGSPKNVRVSWQPQLTTDGEFKRPAFIGPLNIYEMSTPRLPMDDISKIFAAFSFINSCRTAQGNSHTMKTGTLSKGVRMNISHGLNPARFDEDTNESRQQNIETNSCDDCTAVTSIEAEQLVDAVAAIKIVDDENVTSIEAEQIVDAVAAIKIVDDENGTPKDDTLKAPETEVPGEGDDALPNNNNEATSLSPATDSSLQHNDCSFLSDDGGIGKDLENLNLTDEPAETHPSEVNNESKSET